MGSDGEKKSWVVSGLIDPAAQKSEISRFEREILRLEEQKLDLEDFRKFRLENGVYGIRGTMDEHMIRVKIRYGALSADQLDAIAAVAEKFASPKVAHVTTRQAIQMHKIKRGSVPEALELLTKSGLTTREACGNTVRNVSSCPLAGISGEELFDVTPYADAVSGEYSMVKAAAAKGWVDERRLVLELAAAVRRAGADILITYHAKELAEWLTKGER